ncbi:MAG TPA: LysE family translocator [Candidatus Sulfotelmatobacter sp.]
MLVNFFLHKLRKVGLVLGLPSGLAPGPLLALVITQTLKHGTREGLKVALAPLLTDAPIIAFSLWFLIRLGGARSLMGVISLAGGAFLVFLALDSFRAQHIEPGATIAGTTMPRSIGKGALVNLLNPYPYLFWLTVGSPLLIKTWRVGAPQAGAFLGGFYVCMVGSKVFVALLAGRSRTWVTDKLYVWVMRTLGGALLVFAALFAREGFRLLGMIRD